MFEGVYKRDEGTSETTIRVNENGVVLTQGSKHPEHTGDNNYISLNSRDARKLYEMLSLMVADLP